MKDEAAKGVSIAGCCVTSRKSAAGEPEAMTRAEGHALRTRSMGKTKASKAKGTDKDGGMQGACEAGSIKARIRAAPVEEVNGGIKRRRQGHENERTRISTGTLFLATQHEPEFVEPSPVP